MKKLLLTFCMVAAAAAAGAQQTIKAENVMTFSAVALTGGMSVEMFPADSPSLEIELTGILAENVTWGVTGETLSVKVRPANHKEGAMRVRIGYTKLQTVNSNGADIVFKGTLAVPICDISVSAGAKVTATVDCGDLEVRLTGNSAAQLDGKARYLTLRANQNSRIDARALAGQSVSAHAVLNSEIYLYTLERLVADTGTNGSIFYRGEPLYLRTSGKLGGGGNINNIGK